MCMLFWIINISTLELLNVNALSNIRNKHTKLINIVYILDLLSTKNDAKRKKTHFFDFFSPKNLSVQKNVVILHRFCNSNMHSGCSAVRLARLLWEQEVPGSNPGTPTTTRKCRAHLNM